MAQGGRQGSTRRRWKRPFDFSILQVLAIGSAPRRHCCTACTCGCLAGDTQECVSVTLRTRRLREFFQHPPGLSSENPLLLPYHLPHYDMIGLSQTERDSGAGTATLSCHEHGYQEAKGWRGSPCILAEQRHRSEMAGERIREVWHASCLLSVQSPA